MTDYAPHTFDLDAALASCGPVYNRFGETVGADK